MNVVRFLTDTTLIVTLSDGVAPPVTAGLHVGDDQITAAYIGDVAVAIILGETELVAR